MSLSRDDLLTTAVRYHCYAVDAGDLTHTESFEACAHRNCLLIREYVRSHVFDYGRSADPQQPWACERCGGEWPTVDAALAVECAA